MALVLLGDSEANVAEGMDVLSRIVASKDGAAKRKRHIRVVGDHLPPRTAETFKRT